MFVNYREGFHLNTGNQNSIVVDENLPFHQQSMFSQLILDSVKDKQIFPPVNFSNSFGTVDYDADKR